MVIINNNVGANEELTQTSQQHKKWLKWDPLICNNFKPEPNYSKPGKTL